MTAKLIVCLTFAALLSSCDDDNDEKKKCKRPVENGEYFGRYTSHYNLSTNVLTTVVQFFDGKEGESNAVLLPQGQAPMLNDTGMHAASGVFDEEIYAATHYYILKMQEPLASSYAITWNKPDGSLILNQVYFPDPYAQSRQPGGISLQDYTWQSSQKASGHDCFTGSIYSRMDAGVKSR